MNRTVDIITISKGGGNGDKIGAPAGHQKKTSRGVVKYLHGLGCQFFVDCFDCPFDECRWHDDKHSYKYMKSGSE